MKFRNFICLSLMIVILFVPLAKAGQLSPDLKDQISQRSADEIIPVFIKLHRLETVNQLKARSESQAQSREERYQIVREHFQTGHQAAQVQLIEQLRTMTKQSKVQNIKQYWITNAVYAEIEISELSELAKRDDIEWIYPEIKPQLIAPFDISEPLLDPQADSITSNLTYIKADQAWGLGYTGAGRIVCSFDTGVDGLHPALISRWKGHDGDSAAAWFDPGYNRTFPHAAAGSHGTHTMGTMIGWDSLNGYSTGVAPDASWISAAVISIAGTSVVDAFQWAADPDGNPNTAYDVPDVINHSWGYPKTILGCENLVFDLIDNIEALGIVNIFSSGNQGQTGAADTIVFNPANRDLSPTDCFAVGNLNTTVFPPEIYAGSYYGSGASLGGPSDCNGGFKPNAVAPGRDIISTFPNNNYGAMSGTSMAAPHVAGLVLLLREKNPNATPDEIKQAIIASTQSEGAWGALPDNNYGWGAIDCVAALNNLSDNSADPPSLILYDFSHQPISPGDTVTGTITIQNLGITATNVTATINTTNPSLTIIDNSVSFGSINLNSTKTSSGTIKVLVSDTVTPGTRLSVGLAVVGDNVSQNLTLYFLVGDQPEKGIAQHDNGTIKFSLGNYGVLGLGPNSMYRAGGAGFTYKSASSYLWEAGIIIGTSSSQISSGIHSLFDRPDMDFKVIPGGDITHYAPGQSANEETISAFNDDWANSPIGVTIRQHSFSYAYPNDDFIIVRYLIENFSGSTINGLYFGFLMDWDLLSSAQNSGGYDASSSILWTAHNNFGTLSQFRGMKVIQGNQSGALTQSAKNVSWLKFWAGDNDGFTDAEKWTSLISGMPVNNPFEDISDDLFQMMNFGPYNLAHEAVDSLTVAILAGNTMADLIAAGDASLLVPTDIYEDNNNQTLPDNFTLHQNYPNPFNPVTTIKFDLNKPSQYNLTIYNVLGQTVYEAAGQAKPGTTTVIWDASDQASGIYFYRVSSKTFSDSKKMVLIK